MRGITVQLVHGFVTITGLTEYEYVATILQGIRHHGIHRPHIIIYRDDDADAPVVERCADCGFIDGWCGHSVVVFLILRSSTGEGDGAEHEVVIVDADLRFHMAVSLSYVGKRECHPTAVGG